MKQQRGITLIELLTVITIVGILASIAIPSYLEQVRRGRQASAKAMLHEVLQHEERFYSENNTFTSNMADLGYGAGPYLSENGTHTITLAAGPSGNLATSVTISATPVAADPKCGVLSLSSNMATGATGTNPADCW
jgi:type IV pilus assembly protein PilE